MIITTPTLILIAVYGSRYLSQLFKDKFSSSNESKSLRNDVGQISAISDKMKTNGDGYEIIQNSIGFHDN
jgi:hypothetical protein